MYGRLSQLPSKTPLTKKRFSSRLFSKGLAGRDSQMGLAGPSLIARASLTCIL